MWIFPTLRFIQRGIRKGGSMDSLDEMKAWIDGELDRLETEHLDGLSMTHGGENGHRIMVGRIGNDLIYLAPPSDREARTGFSPINAAAAEIALKLSEGDAVFLTWIEGYQPTEDDFDFLQEPEGERVFSDYVHLAQSRHGSFRVCIMN